MFRLMRNFAAFCFLYTLTAFGQTYIIKNVTVVDVENQKLISNQAVVTKDEIISEIAPSDKLKAKPKSPFLDGRGKFLLPEMTDSHVHFFRSGGLYARPNTIALPKYQPYDKEIK